jgi:hypothetical protein
MSLPAARWLSVVLAAASLGLAAWPAQALEMACLWQNLGPAKRDSLLADYKVRGLDALTNVQFTDAELAPLTSACGVTAANAVHGGVLIGAELLMIGSERAFAETYGVSAATLDAAWKSLTPTEHAQLVRLVQNATRSKPVDDADKAPVTRLASRLKVDVGDSAAYTQLIAFVFGRAIQDSWDGTDG